MITLITLSHVLVMYMLVLCKYISSSYDSVNSFVLEVARILPAFLGCPFKPLLCNVHVSVDVPLLCRYDVYTICIKCTFM